MQPVVRTGAAYNLYRRGGDGSCCIIPGVRPHPLMVFSNLFSLVPFKPDLWVGGCVFVCVCVCVCVSICLSVSCVELPARAESHI